MTHISLSKVIAHRGASGYTPENTLASIQKAFELNIPWVELDVGMIYCGELIVLHDANLQRTTGINKPAVNLGLTEIQALDAGSWFDKAYKNEKIPTLGQAFSLIKRYKLGFNLEIKPFTKEQTIPLVEKINKMLLNDAVGYMRHILVSSFSLTALQHLRRINQHVNLGLLMDVWNDDWREQANRLKVASVNLSDNITTQARIAEIKQAGYKVLVYVVNKAERAKILYTWGVDGVFSDFPDRVMERGK